MNTYMYICVMYVGNVIDIDKFVAKLNKNMENLTFLCRF